MRKSEIFAEYLEVVSTETEIADSVILSPSKEADVVDARNILVYILYKKGFYPSEIATLINKSKRCIGLCISNFEERLLSRKMLSIIYKRIVKQLGN